MELKDMVLALIDGGMSQSSIAEAVRERSGCDKFTQGSISKILKHDADPGYKKGKAIELIYLAAITEEKNSSAAKVEY